MGADPKGKLKRTIQNKLLLILCHIFCRHPVPVGYDPEANPYAASKTLHGSYLVLPPLHCQEDPVLQKAGEILQQHNKHTASMFSEYFRIFASTELSNKANEQNGQTHKHLPLSNISFEKNTSELPQSKLLAVVQQRANEYQARSPFAAASGLEDNFDSINGYAETIRTDMAVEPATIPICEWKDVRGRQANLNAYAYDFFQHESLFRIVELNNVRDALGWHMLKVFNTLLLQIQQAFEDVSNMATEQKVLAKDFDLKIKDLESKYIKVQQHAYSIYRGKKRGQHYRHKETGKVIREDELNELKEEMRIMAYGDDLVVAFGDLQKEFRRKWKIGIVLEEIKNINSGAAPTIDYELKNKTKECRRSIHFVFFLLLLFYFGSKIGWRVFAKTRENPFKTKGEHNKRMLCIF
ncbi:hypothetical protein RFI_24366 [Reticulomyxa filosa]|uniref:Uncharacterized protein n=1 Tax=Reticulomyxa filosa TaxID=46433 RepID=X6MH72_RETFI|nr:hypothetical protein RFI_24366 [Reticulomyxa filosa]|eukprot:ETO13006.1 hypothetical protein RFI_24366 [Reticulomyxa filosa]